MKASSPVDKLSGFEQEFIKAELVKAFTSKKFVTSVKIDWYGHLEITSLNWEGYWGNLNSLPAALLKTLNSLKKARTQFYAKGFALAFAKEYCYLYFLLLSQTLQEMSRVFSQELKNFLGRLLAFECFAIKWFGGQSGIAAGTTSHRNPAYLLCKIKNKKTADDPKYLPLVFLVSNGNHHTFYHYRQYCICNDPRFSVFVYLAVTLEQRGESFTLIESFVNGFSSKSDPRSRQRASHLAGEAILPFLKAVHRGSEPRDISFVDLGGGDGLLVKHIWEQVLKGNEKARGNWFLNCSFIGLRTHNPVRYFSKGSTRGTLAYLDYQQQDCGHWIQTEYSKLSGACRHDIVLMCRLLNNISSFKIERNDDEALLWHIMGRRVGPQVLLKRFYRPEICLASEYPISEHLALSNGKTRMSHSALAYRVISLTDYYKGIGIYCGRKTKEDFVYYPIREFNGNSLMAPDGQSILSKLPRIARMTVIEDVDLTSATLKEHISNFQINCCAATININAKKASQVFVVADPQYEGSLPGFRIC